MSKTKPIAAKTAPKPATQAAAKTVAKAAVKADMKAAAAKPAAKAKAKAPVAPSAAVPAADGAAKAGKAVKLRQKPVRDSFTMPEADFALIAALKARLLAARRETKKSELLRAGLHVLAGLDTKALAATLAGLDPIKVGRPKKSH